MVCVSEPVDVSLPTDEAIDHDGVDRSLIRRHLAMTPEERLRALDEHLAFLDSVRVTKRAPDGAESRHPSRPG
jgi:hypothetical protein